MLAASRGDRYRRRRSSRLVGQRDRTAPDPEDGTAAPHALLARLGKRRLAVSAELYEHASSPVLAASPVLQDPVVLPTRWWSQVRAALTTLADVPTRRHTTTREYLDAMMPRLLGHPLPADRWTWRAAHGDLHLANLCGPSLSILDWEGWGLAPVGYDAATLHVYCLRVPMIAAQVRAQLPVLNTPAGRFAELAVITELLHAASRGAHLLLVPRLLTRAEELLGRPVPVLSQ